MSKEVMFDTETVAAAQEEAEAMTQHLMRVRQDGPEMLIRVKRTVGAGYQGAGFLEIGGRIVGRVNNPDVILAGGMYLQQLYREFLRAEGV
jgi:hypothetical protein